MDQGRGNRSPPGDEVTKGLQKPVRGTAAVAILLATLASAAAWAESPSHSLLYDVSVDGGIAGEALDGALSVRTARINFGLLRSGRLSLDTGEGLPLELTRSRDITYSNGAQVWEGSIEGKPDSSVLLGKYGKSLSGAIRFDGRLFKLVPLEGGRHALAEFPPGQPAPEVPPVADGGGAGEPAAAQSSATPDGGVVVDVMVVYTPAAASAVSSQGGIESLIATAIAESNAAYQNSAINMQLNLVHTEQVDYAAASGSSGWSTDLNRLAGSSDGYMDTIHATRDAVGADMVALIRAGEATYCGIGYLNNSLTAGGAFSVTRYNCATGYYSFAHELGHNKGSHHDPDTAGGDPALFSYSYGFRDPGAVFRTVMAYNCPGGCTRYQYFSNPDVTFQSTGLPTGVENETDNARSINYAATVAAGWRLIPVGSAPAGPSNASVTGVTSEQIALAWTDNSDNESSFRVQQSQDGVNFSEIATTAANTNSYTVTSLDSATEYWFRIFAHNSLGYSSTHAATSATTSAPPAHIYRVAYGESTTKASVSGTYLNTQADDGVVQAITETGSGGPKRRRHSLLEHRWSVDVAPGSAASLLLEASSVVGGGEELTFAWSSDLSEWHPVLSLVGNTSDAYWELPLLPTPSGTVYIRVRDNQRTDGVQSSNRVSVDYLAVRSDTAAVEPLTEAPVVNSASVSDYTTAELSWGDLQGEAGYEIVRSGNGETVDPAAVLSANTTSYQDAGLAENTTYTFHVRGYNSEGPSPDSAPAQVTTGTLPPPSALPLSVNSYKRKGVKTVELTWGDSSSPVHVYRDGGEIGVVTEPQSGTYNYRDSLGKGGGTYVYRICLPDGTTCSDDEVVVF